MIISTTFLVIFVSGISARHYYRPDMKPGSFGYLSDGDVLKTWTAEEFEEFKESNPFIELLLVVYPFLRPDPVISSASGAAAVGARPLAQSSQLSQASSSVGSGGSFASAGVKPSGQSAPSLTGVKSPVTTSSVVSTNNERLDSSSSTSSLKDETNTSSITKFPQSISESTFLDIKSDNSSVEETMSGSEEEVSNSDNEVDRVFSTSSSNPVSKDTAKPTTDSGEDKKSSDKRPSNSRPGFSSATSAAGVSSEVHAEGSSLAESPGDSKGNSHSNSNSAAVVYGEFSGSVSISSSSASG